MSSLIFLSITTWPRFEQNIVIFHLRFLKNSRLFFASVFGLFEHISGLKKAFFESIFFAWTPTKFLHFIMLKIFLFKMHMSHIRDS